jgi:hypothetical protein
VPIEQQLSVDTILADVAAEPGGEVLGWSIAFNEKRAALSGTHITDHLFIKVCSTPVFPKL